MPEEINMCLNTLTKTFDKPVKKVRRAWKIVDVRRSGAGFITPFQSTLLLPGKWNVSTVQTLKTDEWQIQGYERWRSKKEYPSGFHVFPNKKAAALAIRLLKNYSESGRKIVPVEISEITAQGFDGTSDDSTYINSKIPCLVARKLRLV